MYGNDICTMSHQSDKTKIRFVNENEMRSQTNAYIDNTTATSDETIDLVELNHGISFRFTKPKTDKDLRHD